MGDCWGVVLGLAPGAHGWSIDWWTGQYASGYVEEWYTRSDHYADNVGAPFADNYAGIPDEVIARSMTHILLGGVTE